MVLHPGWTAKQCEVHERIMQKEQLRLRTKKTLVKKNDHVLKDVTDEFEFKLLSAYLKCSKKGDVKRMLKRFKIHHSTLQRIRTKHKIDYYSLAGTARKSLEKKIIQLYELGYSTLAIVDMINKRFCDAQINNILRKHNVEIRKPNEGHKAFFSSKNSSEDKYELPTILTKMYLEGKNIKEIRKETGLDEVSIAKKLKYMGMKVEAKRTKTKVEYTCLWCGRKDFAWTTGKKMQKYCGNSCSCKARDLRRTKGTPNRINNMLKELQNIWGDNFETALARVLDGEKYKIKPEEIYQIVNEVVEL